MQAVLKQMNTLPGIVGSMVYDTEGQILAQAFPALFDSDSLAGAAGVLLNGAAGLETAAGKISIIDLRFGESRIVVRPVTGANLLLFCSAQANLQFLNISIGMAIPKIEKLVASQPALTMPAAAKPAATDPKNASKDALTEKLEELKGFESGLKKVGSWMKRQALS